jgi:hypothetical protein
MLKQHDAWRTLQKSLSDTDISQLRQIYRMRCNDWPCDVDLARVYVNGRYMIAPYYMRNYDEWQKLKKILGPQEAP